MARRIILGQRGAEYGLWVSKPGVDVFSASAADMLFDMSTRRGMVLEEGSAVVPGGGNSVMISFARVYPSIPLVFCGQLRSYPSLATVRTQATQTGFSLSSIQDQLTGAWFAAGDTVQWFVVMQTES
jgi:hypothetical protein